MREVSTCDADDSIIRVMASVGYARMYLIITTEYKVLSPLVSEIKDFFLN